MPNPQILDQARNGSKILIGSRSGQNRNRILLTGFKKNVLKNFQMVLEIILKIGNKKLIVA